MDRLTVEGLGKRVDGDYDCDLTSLLVNVASPDALLVSEAERIKKLCGASGYDIATQFLGGDWPTQAAVALVILARHGAPVNEQQVWGARVGAFRFVLAPAEADQEAVADPTAAEGTTPSTSGGESGDPTSETNQGNDPAPTGHLQSVA